jgi:arginyl-tRNA synthetase
MILNLQRHVHDAIADAVTREWNVTEVPAFSVEVPPNRALGDLAVTVAFQLARTLRKAPRAIAQQLAAALEAVPGIARVDAAQNGYLNLFLDRRVFLLARVRGEVAAVTGPTEKTIVEHTAINPNKAAHIGHLRNAALGDTLVRALRFRGTPVEVQNYIDDTGVQVADVIVGFRELEGKSLDEVRHLADTTRFDYYCWDLYSRVTEWYDGNAARLAVRASALHDLEQGGNDTATMGAVIVDRIVRAHLATMARLNVSYDLLTYEGDILRLKFWATIAASRRSQAAHRCGPRHRKRASRPLHPSAGLAAFTTLSTLARCTSRPCSVRRCGRWVTPTRRRTRSISRTKWSRSRTRLPGSSDTRWRPAATRPPSRLSRCPGGKAWA